MLPGATSHPSLLPSIIAAVAAVSAAAIAALIAWVGQRRAAALQRQTLDQSQLLRDIRDAIREQSERQQEGLEQFLRDFFNLERGRNPRSRSTP